jgi:acetylglutamate kinase
VNPTVIKIGGALAGDADALGVLWDGVQARRLVGPVVVVHGGGPQSTRLAERLGHTPRFVAGRRVTTALDLDVALWTMRGELNARLVAAARTRGVPAVGLSGIDGGLVTVVRRSPREIDGRMVDFGHVGDVVRVDPSVLLALLQAGFVPVVAPVCADAAGNVFNVNADTVALAIAEAMGAAALLLVAESGGVFAGAGPGAGRLAEIDAAEFDAGVEAGWIAGGMRPKLEVGLRARDRGIVEVRVCAPAGLADSSLGTRIR